MAFIPTDEHLKAPGNWISDEGNYTLKVIKIESVVSPSSGNPGHKLTLECVESGARMTETLWETEKAYWRICRFAKACSVQIRRGDPLEIDNSYIGKTFDAEVEMGEPNAKGDRYPQIKDFGEGEFESLFTDSAPAKVETQTPTKKW